MSRDIADFICRNWLHVSMAEEQVIYALVDPRSANVCYIGHTGDLRKRYREHIQRRYVGGSNILKGIWIDELIEQGMEPALIVLEYTSSAKVSERERRWMFHYFQQGAPLLNMEAIYQHMVAAIQACACDFLTLPLNAQEWIKVYEAWRRDVAEARSVDRVIQRFAEWGLEYPIE